MRLHWNGLIHVQPTVDQVYAYLADFNRHPEWAGSVARLDCLDTGDAQGVGARYSTIERVDLPRSGWRRLLPRRTGARTICEVRSLVPNRYISWHAHPVPHIGNADLAFDLSPSPNGGTIIRQTVDEYYPLPAALLLRVVYNLDEPAIREILDDGLQRLKHVIDKWPSDPADVTFND